MKKPFWKADWFLALVVCALFVPLAGGEWVQRLERMAYDVGMRISHSTPSDKLAVIAIDDESIANIGRWPWPRDVMARLTEQLAGAGAKVIANTVFFLEPQEDPGLLHIEALLDFYDGSNLSRPSGNAALDEELGVLGRQLREAEQQLNTDRQLAAAMKRAGNVVLAMPFVLGDPMGREDQPLPPYVLASALENVRDEVGAYERGVLPPAALAAVPPTAQLGAEAAAVGHLNRVVDVDGAVRTVPLVINYYDQFIPSMALLTAARTLNLEPRDIRVRLGEGIDLGNLTLATDPDLSLHPFFYKEIEGFPPFPVDTFYDVVSGKIPLTKYAGKTVLIGATATGVGTPQVTPVAPAMAPVVALAHAVSSILKGDFFLVPAWAGIASHAALGLVALYLVLLLPRLKAAPGAVFTLLLLALLLGSEFGMLLGSFSWVQLVAPATLLLVGHLLLTTKRFLVTEKGKERVEASSAESNRMLGLAFQGQGQLDMAFEKFRRAPLDGAMMELLYNLALDYERKRQFNKAGAVYRYMAEFDAKFRDIQSRMKRNDQLENTVMLGGGGGMAATVSIDAAGDVEKPRLGRYEIDKELGKGAMGVVYLGRDPKINRVVAIKTMALSQEFEEDELEEVKSRFFREAETAGRLNHPLIVSIFDAGEEQELAYIAMEFLKGRDLGVHTRADSLLPVIKVFEIIMKVAVALDYAHKQNVVHRDIKPANIMYDAETGQLKVTDFGIARITDSSKTKTGMVLGTPSYMSPEQLAGKRVDGRSDLFSLGVMCFQMFTGQLPFQGDSMAALMFKIANDPHPDPLKLRGELPAGLRAFFDRALAKDREERFQTGRDFALTLKQCAAEYVAQRKQEKGA